MANIEAILQCSKQVSINPNSTIVHSMENPATVRDRIADKKPPAARKLCPVDNDTLIAVTPPIGYQELSDRFVQNGALDKDALEKYLATCAWACDMWNTPKCPLYQEATE